MRTGWKNYRGILLALLWMVAAVPAFPAENLLKNGSLEDAEGDLPVGWQVFVMPSEGASGTLDSTTAHEGSRSVQLSTTAPYDIEPYNNWSQNIVADLAGKPLVAKAFVRTVGAGGAALWVQCWRKNPWSVIKAATVTARDDSATPLEWRPVELHVSVPEGTDYVTVRCVLKGTGSVWFDDVSLEIDDSLSTGTADGTMTSPKAPSKPIKPVPPAKLREGTSTTTKEAPAATPTRTSELESAAPDEPLPENLDREAIRQLINANRVLTEGYKALRETNESLAQQVKALEAEVNRLRGRAKASTSGLPSTLDDNATSDRSAAALEMLRGALGTNSTRTREKSDTQGGASPPSTGLKRPALPDAPRPPFVPSTTSREGNH